MERRHFLVSTIGALGASASVFADTPSDNLRVAVVGCGGRGGTHLSAWAAREASSRAQAGAGGENAEGAPAGRADRGSEVKRCAITAICDVDDSHTAKALKTLQGYGVAAPKTYKDIRKIIEDKDIDVVSIATPNHWHTLMTIWAVQGGKDVYVEKPCSHNIFEAKQIVAAARKYNRMVQQGSQIRSSKAVQEAMQKMHDGLLGDIYMARGLCYKQRDDIGHAPVEQVPAGVDYDLWTGPSPMHPFTQNRFHYNWHWFWDTGNGDLGNQGIHQVDIARWGLGVKYPVKATAIGGHFMFDDDQETPNTLSCAWEFNEAGKKKMMEFEVRHWDSNGEASVGDPSVKGGTGGGPGDTIGALYYGSKGYLAVDSYQSYRSWLAKEPRVKKKRPEMEPGPSGNAGGGHFANFADAVRKRDRGILNAEIEVGAASTILVHLANISYRVGRTVNFDPNSLTITGDKEAAAMMTRQYRKGYEVPEKV
jgi:predicted dehydrogenase